LAIVEGGKLNFFLSNMLQCCLWHLNVFCTTMQLDISDFHGKELSLKLHKDGNLGNLESSSGKSYELVSYKAQQPDATVFQPSGSEIKPVGKISRRVCLVRYPEPEELVKPNFGGLTPSSKISAGNSFPEIVFVHQFHFPLLSL